MHEQVSAVVRPEIRHTAAHPCHAVNDEQTPGWRVVHGSTPHEAVRTVGTVRPEEQIASAAFEGGVVVNVHGAANDRAIPGISPEQVNAPALLIERRAPERPHAHKRPNLISLRDVGKAVAAVERTEERFHAWRVAGDPQAAADDEYVSSVSGLERPDD